MIATAKATRKVTRAPQIVTDSMPQELLKILDNGPVVVPFRDPIGILGRN